MRKLYLFFKLGFYLLIVLFGVGIFGAYGSYTYYAKDLPKITSLKDYTPFVISEVFADDGQKIGEFWKQRRIVLAPDEIPRLFKDAIVASEDQRFFEHSGIDYLGIVRAALEGLKKGKLKQGASTITQQVARNFFLTNERTIHRKIREAILAKRIEDSLDKTEILHLYLNQIYLGNRAYGIEAAAQNYFHKTARELNTAEVAMVVALAKGGSYYDPTRYYKRAKERQEYVLKRMREMSYISAPQYDRAKAYKLVIYKAPTDKQYNRQFAPWFVEEVRRQLVDKYGSHFLYTQGLKIYTTVNMKAQRAADLAVMRGTAEIHKRHGYSGPLENLPASEWDKFHAENQKRLYIDNFHPQWIPTTTPASTIQSAQVALKPKKFYKALVTEVNRQDQTITARVGNVSGVIKKWDFGWARKRNLQTWGRNGRLYLTNPGKKFKVGDVIEVQLKDTSKDKKNRYKADVTYFTLEETTKVESALFSYDPHTGYVKAIVGGKDFSQSEFNRATQARRQTGSVFKPLLYASALDKGYDPDFIINDTPIRVPEGPNSYWEPRNSDGQFKGPLTFKDALRSSRNVVSAKIILDVGTDYVTGLIRKLGISTKLLKVYSMALGSNEMKVSEMARSFGIFPTGGILPEYIYVTRITDRFGTLLEQNEPKLTTNFKEQIKSGSHEAVGSGSIDPTNVNRSLREDLWSESQYWIDRDKLELSPFEKIILYGKHIPDGYVINPKTAYTMIPIMQSVVQGGTGWRVRALGRPVAGKTGTTNDNTDAWFIGYTPNVVTAVWTGHDKTRYKLGFGEEGGSAAAPIFLYYMRDFLKDTPKLSFKIPPEIESPQIASPIQVAPGSGLEMFSNTLEGGGGADIFLNDL